MAELKVLHWNGHPDGLTAKDRQPCEYTAYIPDPLMGRSLTLEGAVSGRVADAEAAIARLQSEAAHLFNTETIARLLLRAESVASSRIEGLVIGARKLLRAEAAREAGEDPRDVTAMEVLGNIDAMLHGIRAVGPGQAITLDLLLEMHRRLLVGTAVAEHGGQLRRQQNWIGGSSFTPRNAAFVPPPPAYVRELCEDLCIFCNSTELSPVTQAALAHAQFETIHPFADGNGRTGRALVHLILRRRGLVDTVLPPISLVLATSPQDYVEGLMATRYKGKVTARAAHAGINLWVERFATACTRAVTDVRHFQTQARSIREAWRKRLGKVRAHSASERLMDLLLSTPIVTVKTAAAMIQRTFPATNNAVAALVGAGILKQISLGKRNRAFEAPEVLTAFTSLERRLASPAGDTRVAKPVRLTPARR